MEKTINETHVLLSEFKSDKNLISLISNDIKSHTTDNVIVNLSDIKVTEDLLDELNKLSDIHKENGMSFVTVVTNVSPDHVEETFTICPTLGEAEDIVVMENLERELGF